MSPLVSVVIPARNEERHIEACVRSVLAQEAAAELEILVVDGRSTDRTAERARAAGAAVVDNPDRITAAALNRALDVARGEYFLRFDAHSEMPPGYVEACLRAHAEEQGAGNVGGWCDPRGVGPWGRALAAALTSKLGVGHAGFWRPPPPGRGRYDTDHVHFGCFPMKLLREVGGWREDLAANEDFELDRRVRRTGARVIFDPAVWSIYRPRESLAAIARQYVRHGRGKAASLVLAPESLRPRQLAPPALLATIGIALLPSPFALPARGALGVYALAVGAAAVRAAAGWRTAAVLPTIHLAWGAGLLWGLTQAALNARPRRGSNARLAREAPASRTR